MKMNPKTRGTPHHRHDKATRLMLAHWRERDACSWRLLLAQLEQRQLDSKLKRPYVLMMRK
jgi:hypothetical protein